MSRRLPICLLAWFFSPVACEREPLEVICAEWASGELVVTEVRGKQQGIDTFGQWLELASAASAEKPVAGLKLILSRWDGSGRKEITVRDAELRLAPGGFLVLGRFPPDNLPSYVDYGFEQDFSGDLYPDAILTVDACGVEVDTVTWKNLTSAGSWSFDGALLPDALTNDEEKNWCVDDTAAEPSDGGTAQAGLPGTPGRKNKECK